MDFNVKHKTLELLEKNRRKSWGLGLVRKLIILDLTPKAWFIYGKNNYLNLIKMKKLLPFEKPCKMMKKINQRLEEKLLSATFLLKD